MESPCIDICSLDSRDGLCDGCHRSIEEIMAWSRLTAFERQTIMKSLPQRAMDRMRPPVQETATA
ncbi:hypothetical protein RU07_19490 [Agrobacterium tumefaciens]|uniref:DUF1289 domain-containing protein n=1 Tax=Agrobacterium tumefaciens TaxID=358 RepID=A0A0D0KMP2_AGRTU|nr:hypothetical protein RU07_19490 [Agrobacterium tumefaciens]